MASQDAFEHNGQNHHTGNTKHGYITRWFSKMPRVLILAPTYMSRKCSTLTDRLVCLIWPKRTPGTGRKDLQMHQTISNLGWLGQHNGCKCSKDLRLPAKWWHNHSTTQYKGSEASYKHMEVVGTQLRLKLNNPRQLRFSNTSSWEIEEKA